MYTTCLFCGSGLGTNEAIEPFPVGERVAFDAARGRLWAVCGRCGRWNLAPIEERWEAVEAAERLFADTRMRAQSENIGLARLPDGTRLVRVGAALPGEFAAWRYGGELISRRRRNITLAGAGMATTAAMIAGAPLLISAGGPAILLISGLQLTQTMRDRRLKQRVMHRLPAAESPNGRELVLRYGDLHGAVLALSSTGTEFMLQVPTPARLTAMARWTGRDDGVARVVEVRGEPARRVVARAMTDYNRGGATRRAVENALQMMDDAGGPDRVLADAAALGVAVTRGTTSLLRLAAAPWRVAARGPAAAPIGEAMKRTVWYTADRLPRLGYAAALALEIALNEESERRALEGELAVLEAAWREAEAIARIADALPDVPPPASFD